MSIIKYIRKIKTALGLYSAYSSRDTRAVFSIGLAIGFSCLRWQVHFYGRRK